MPCPTGIAVGVTDPLACFHLFLPQELYDDVVLQTNLYGSQQQTIIKGDTRPFTLTELMAFIGINIAMGIVSLPALRNYWTNDAVLSHPWFRLIMGTDSFLKTLWYFHGIDNTTAYPREVIMCMSNMTTLPKSNGMTGKMFLQCPHLLVIS